MPLLKMVLAEKNRLNLRDVSMQWLLLTDVSMQWLLLTGALWLMCRLTVALRQ